MIEDFMARKRKLPIPTCGVIMEPQEDFQGFIANEVTWFADEADAEKFYALRCNQERELNLKFNVIFVQVVKHHKDK